MTDDLELVNDDLDVRVYELPKGRPPPGPWAAEGACVGKPADWFFPARGEAAHEALALCRSCPVRQQCLEHAIRHKEKHGVWGGTSERQRRRMRRSTRTTTPGEAA